MRFLITNVTEMSLGDLVELTAASSYIHPEQYIFLGNCDDEVDGWTPCFWLYSIQTQKYSRAPIIFFHTDYVLLFRASI